MRGVVAAISVAACLLVLPIAGTARAGSRQGRGGWALRYSRPLLRLRSALSHRRKLDATLRRNGLSAPNILRWPRNVPSRLQAVGWAARKFNARVRRDLWILWRGTLVPVPLSVFRAQYSSAPNISKAIALYSKLLISERGMSWRAALRANLAKAMRGVKDARIFPTFLALQDRVRFMFGVRVYSGNGLDVRCGARRARRLRGGLLRWYRKNRHNLRWSKARQMFYPARGGWTHFVYLPRLHMTVADGPPYFRYPG